MIGRIEKPYYVLFLSLIAMEMALVIVPLVFEYYGFGRARSSVRFLDFTIIFFPIIIFISSFFVNVNVSILIRAGIGIAFSVVVFVFSFLSSIMGIFLAVELGLHL